MARRRMIDPNFWRSEDVAKLDYFERLFLIGLFSNADDYGRGLANVVYLRSIIFPYDDIPIEKLNQAMQNIIKHINFKIYEINDKQYYFFTNWNEWQRVDKPQKSLIPSPHIKQTKSSKDTIKNEEYKNDSVKTSEQNVAEIKNDSQNDSKNDSQNDSDNNIKEANIREANIREANYKKKNIIKEKEIVNSKTKLCPFTNPRQIEVFNLSDTEKYIQGNVLISIQHYQDLCKKYDKDNVDDIISQLDEWFNTHTKELKARVHYQTLTNWLNNDKKKNPDLYPIPKTERVYENLMTKEEAEKMGIKDFWEEIKTDNRKWLQDTNLSLPTEKAE